jgi:ribosomal protein L11 methylase PrmA
MVLDVGTGSNLLALLAAKAGASKAFDVELSKATANMARQVIRVKKKNGTVPTNMMMMSSNKPSTPEPLQHNVIRFI